MVNDEEKTDFLEVDDPIGGQQFVCLSFVSPEDIIQNKEAFKTAKFLQSYAKDKGMKFLIYKSKKYAIACERKFEIDELGIVIGFSSKGCF